MSFNYYEGELNKLPGKEHAYNLSVTFDGCTSDGGTLHQTKRMSLNTDSIPTIMAYLATLLEPKPSDLLGPVDIEFAENVAIDHVTEYISWYRIKSVNEIRLDIFHRFNPTKEAMKIKEQYKDKPELREPILNYFKSYTFYLLTK